MLKRTVGSANRPGRLAIDYGIAFGMKMLEPPTADQHAKHHTNLPTVVHRGNPSSNGSGARQSRYCRGFTTSTQGSDSGHASQ
jgi:hypothetical protein